MKIGVITILDNNNYGNRLQNYALQKVLNSFRETETIKYNFNDDYSFMIKSLKKVHYMLYMLKRIILRNITISRMINFRKFNKNISYSKKKFNLAKLKNSEDYDKFIVGSDQVWNPTHGRLTDYDVLKDFPSEKCFSYAASFGVYGISNQSDKNVVKKEIGKFNSLSVREESGKKIIKEICNRDDVEVVLDPTMLLSSEDWDMIVAQSSLSIDDDYIFIYFLGGVNREVMKKIEQLSANKRWKIVNVLDNKSSFFNCGPSEFLYLIKNAKIIFTDSFHASVFSIIYNKDFGVFDREGVKDSMNSRIETLFKLLGIDKNDMSERFGFELPNYDYKKINKKLNDEKKKSIKYISNIIK